jgi:hypothetical protein
LFKKGLGGVEFERQSRFADCDCGSLLIHLFSLEIPFQCIEEKTIMRNAIPIENFLLLLRSDAVVLVEEIEERTFRLFQGCICSRLEIAEIGEYAFLELLGVLHWPAKRLKAEGKASYDICPRNMEEVVP